ncbi:MAG: helix-turn-helix domain-containing protein, partial [Tissierellia bacterium]|nr:helix-turn-helix domain-containing protein [Tissierellia bacterium]
DYCTILIALKYKSDRIEQLNHINIRHTFTQILLNSGSLPEDFYNNVMIELDWIKDINIIGICLKYNNDEIDIINMIEIEFNEYNYLWTKKEDSFLLFVSGLTKEELEIKIKNVLKEINKLKERINISIGISQEYNHIRYIRTMYNEAYLAAMFKTNGYEYYNNLEILKLLYLLKDHDEIIEYYNRTVKKIVEYDTENETSLFETLQTLLKTNFNKTVTASKLYIHVETLRYRLNRIEEITGYSLNNTEDVFALQLGIKIKTLIENK